MPKVQLLFFDAGGGHRNAATALHTVCAKRYPSWEVELVNVGKLLEPLDFFHRYLGIAGEDVYNKILQHGLTLGSRYMLRCTQAIIRMNRSGIVRVMTDYWKRTQPDLVVSLIPNFNRPLFLALAAACPQVPYVTVMTDLADFPPHFWIEHQPQYLVCGTDRAVQQAKEAGYLPEQIRRSSGMILHPRFYDAPLADAARSMETLGLRDDLPTALVLFGGQGAKVMNDIYDQLLQIRHPVQAIFLCGKNETLARQLRERKEGLRAQVVGFTTEVPHYMKVSDFFIGKPGPGSLSEAIHMNLPVIVQRNAWTMPQERYNAEWIQERRVGLVIRHFRQTAEAVNQLLEGNLLESFRRNAQAIQNEAVFEIPQFLEEILAAGPATKFVPSGHFPQH
jgi:UDP-N-acetylglucosamine:LPS N-acetylglucosamine transferase